MELKEYIAQAKKELDEMESKWKAENEKDPANWPLDMSEEDWGDQELAQRFSQ